MQILEDYGVAKIKEYYTLLHMKQKSKQKYTSVASLYASTYFTRLFIVAFIIGFGLTFPVIWLELYLDVFNFDNINYLNIFLYSLALIVLVFLEFYLLFLLGFYTIAYFIYHLEYLDDINSNALNSSEFLQLFSRTIMELPEKHEVKYNIRHQEIQNHDILIFSLVYKLKVVVSNFILKFITKRILSRTTFRIYSPYIATIGTGIWDAFVFYKTIRHSQYKVMVRFTVESLIQNKISVLSNEWNVKAILARYYSYSEYNTNFTYLLESIEKYVPVEYTQEEYLEALVNKKSNQELLVLLFCFKEKLHNKKERKFISSLKKDQDISNIRKALREGNVTFIQEYLDRI